MEGLSPQMIEKCYFLKSVLILMEFKRLREVVLRIVITSRCRVSLASTIWIHQFQFEHRSKVTLGSSLREGCLETPGAAGMGSDVDATQR